MKKSTTLKILIVLAFVHAGLIRSWKQDTGFLLGALNLKENEYRRNYLYSCIILNEEAVMISNRLCPLYVPTKHSEE